jgi:ribokinase
VIVVLGSINIDLVVRVEELARPGETVSGEDLRLFPGGKGANQAVAAAMAGASVRMVGAIGKDGFADIAMRGLKEAGIDIQPIRAVERPTGVALIAVDRRGQNSITVAPGANFSVTASWLQGSVQVGDHLALQLEIPLDEVERAIAIAKANGARICLNAAPAKELPEHAYAGLDYLVVNETEAQMIAARYGLPLSPDGFARAARQRWGGATIVTLGGEGALGVGNSHASRVRAPSVVAVDTTAAGDSFLGAFLAALDAGRGLERGLKEGVAAGSLACTKEGAQTSMPFAHEIKDLADRLEVRSL